MRYILFLFSLFTVTPSFSSSDELKLKTLISQQNCLHSDKHIGEYQVLLGEWQAELSSLPSKPAQTYFFWTDAGKDEYWLRPFLTNLRADLAHFGVKIGDRVGNHLGMGKYLPDEVALVSCEKILLLMTDELALCSSSRNYDLSRADLSVISLRLNGAKGVKLKSGSILPMCVSGYSIGLYSVVNESPECFLDEEKMGLYSSYFQLLIRLIQFTCDVPSEVDFFSKSLMVLLTARKELTAELKL